MNYKPDDGFLFALGGGVLPSREFLTHMETSLNMHWWRTANVSLCSALMAIEQWGSFGVSHLLWHGTSVLMAISKDPWHSHLLPSVWQWNCHYLFLRLRSVAAGNLTQNLPLARRTLQPIARPQRYYMLSCKLVSNLNKLL